MAIETSELRKEAIGQYLDAWAAAFADVLQQIASPDCRVAIDREEPGIERAREAVKDGFSLSLACSGALKGRQALRVSDADALALARVLAGEEYGEADREAAAELLRQVAGQAAGRLRGQGGQEVGFQDAKTADSEGSVAAAAAIRLDGATPAPVVVLLEMDADLGEAIGKRADSAAHAAESGAERAELRAFLERPEVREIAENGGVDIKTAQAAVAALDDDDLNRLSGHLTEAQATLAGGDTIVISTTAIIIGLLVLIVILVA